MKRFHLVLRFMAVLIMTVLMMSVSAFADPARFLNEDNNREYHWQHLQMHIGSTSCLASGNYIKVRPEAGSSHVIGHLEKADVFRLDDVWAGWARITVIYHADTSPDSYVGLSGWVNADYVECQCSREEYYSGRPRRTYSLAAVSVRSAKLRELPSRGSPNHATILQGERVQVLGEYIGNDNYIWYRVRYGEKAGFLRADMVEILETGIPETGMAAAQSSGGRGYQSGTSGGSGWGDPAVSGSSGGSGWGDPAVSGSSGGSGWGDPAGSGSSSGSGWGDPAVSGSSGGRGDPAVSGSSGGSGDPAATASSGSSGYPEGSWQKVYHDFILGRQYRVRQADVGDPDLYEDVFGNIYDASAYGSIAFGLFDMDGDGNPELIADNGYPDGGFTATYVYSVTGGELDYIGSIGSRAGGPYIITMGNYSGIVTRAGNMGYFLTEYTEMLVNGALYTEEVYAEDYNDPDAEDGIRETPMVEVLTSNENLYEVIHSGALKDIARYRAEIANESNWNSFLRSAGN